MTGKVHGPVPWAARQALGDPPKRFSRVFQLAYRRRR
jgi:hypothetical protein